MQIKVFFSKINNKSHEFAFQSVNTQNQTWPNGSLPHYSNSSLWNVNLQNLTLLAISTHRNYTLRGIICVNFPFCSPTFLEWVDFIYRGTGRGIRIDATASGWCRLWWQIGHTHTHTPFRVPGIPTVAWVVVSSHWRFGSRPGLGGWLCYQLIRKAVPARNLLLRGLCVRGIFWERLVICAY